MNARLDIADMVRELVERHTHREHYTVRCGSTWYGRDHVTAVPSLLWQLEHASPSGAGDERSNAGYSSRPTARLEALDTLVRIDIEAAGWVRDLGEDDPDGTARCIQLLHGLLASADDVTRRAAEHDIRRWWTQARIVTGWDSPAWRPANTCPHCAVKGGLRVKLADQVAFCAECRETWDQGTIGLLADHIRAENAEDRDGAGAREAS